MATGTAPRTVPRTPPAPPRRVDRTRPAPPARFTLETDWTDLPDHLWWDPAGPAKLLHAMNPVRAAYYLDRLGLAAPAIPPTTPGAAGGGRTRGATGAVAEGAGTGPVASQPGPSVLDAGCGGGLLARELAAAGATVYGLDLGTGSLKVARRAVPERFHPVAGRLEALPLADGALDAVVAADVLEHVPDLPAAAREVARVLRPGGDLLLDTINRTPWAWFVGIFGVEHVTGMVPRGTHDWRLFIRPRELDHVLRAAGLRRVELTGLAPRIGPADIARGLLTRRLDPPAFRTGGSRAASYLAHYRKPVV